MTTSTVRFTGPAGATVGVMTELADADGVDLRSSDTPAANDDGTVSLTVTVDGDLEALLTALDGIRAGLPDGSALELVVEHGSAQ